MPGFCKGCGNPSSDTDICDRCEARADAQECRHTNYTPSKIHIPYDPETDIF